MGVLFKNPVPINLITADKEILRKYVVEREGIKDPREVYLKIVSSDSYAIGTLGSAVDTAPFLKEGSNLIFFETHELEDCSDLPLATESFDIKCHSIAPDVSLDLKTNDKNVNLIATCAAVTGLMIEYIINGVVKTFEGTISSETDLADGTYEIQFRFRDELGLVSDVKSFPLLVDSTPSAKPVVSGTMNSQSTVISFSWFNTLAEKEDISKYRYKITGEDDFKEVDSTTTSVTKDVKINGSYTITVQSCDKEGLNWSEESTFTTIVASLAISSLKFVNVSDQKIKIVNKFMNLSTSYDTSYIKDRLPLFYIETKDEDSILAPTVLESPSIALLFVEQLKENIEASSDLEDIKNYTKLIMQLKMIINSYGDAPFGICINTTDFKTVMVNPVKDSDTIFQDMILSEKRFRAVFDFSEESSASNSYFISINEVCKSCGFLYFGIDKQLSAAMDSDNIHSINTAEIKSERYYPTELSNYLPDFNLSKVCGITNCQFRIPFSKFYPVEEDLIFLASKSGIVIDYETDYMSEMKYDFDAREVVFPKIAYEFYLSYNNKQKNTTIVDIDMGFKPIKYMSGVGIKNDDISEDYRSVNMTALVNSEGFISKLVFKNEHKVNLKEAHIVIGVERINEIIYSTLKKMEENKMIRPSNALTLNMNLSDVVESNLNNVAKSVSVTGSFSKKTIGTKTVEVFGVKSKAIFATRYSEIEVVNEIYY